MAKNWKLEKKFMDVKYKKVWTFNPACNNSVSVVKDKIRPELYNVVLKKAGFYNKGSVKELFSDLDFKDAKESAVGWMVKHQYKNPESLFKNPVTKADYEKSKKELLKEVF